MRDDSPLEITPSKSPGGRYVLRGGVMVGFAFPIDAPKPFAIAGVWYPGGDLIKESFESFEEALEWAVNLSQAVGLLASDR